ncbi:hypothetical protein [Amycolatopsis sp. cmx-11-12]|uniref:hypothetical protein n=1 Tax=Amycolatopsis sp. cmx-11-12 TaxID=2785795 RepID=UPI0039174CB3
MDEDGLYEQLRHLRVAEAGGQRMPHKPLLLLWLLGRYLNERSTAVAYDVAEGPVGGLIERFGGGALQRTDRAAMPFVHLERTLWTVEADGHTQVANSPSRSGSWLRKHSVRGTLRPEVVDLLDEPWVIFKAADVLFDNYFTPGVVAALRSAVHLDHLGASPSTAALARATPAVTKRVQLAFDTDELPDPLTLPPNIENFDFDTQLRWNAFSWLTDLIRTEGRNLPSRKIKGFTFNGQDFPLLDQQGIWKPRQLDVALSIRTTYTSPQKKRPYEDEVGKDGLVRYKYRGTEPGLFANVALRRAWQEKRPLIWFKAVAKSVYEPHFPFWVVADEPERLQIVGSFDSPDDTDSAWSTLIENGRHARWNAK